MAIGTFFGPQSYGRPSTPPPRLNGTAIKKNFFAASLMSLLNSKGGFREKYIAVGQGIRMPLESEFYDACA